jgi:FMN phosphatase YigB (HAD superfamily)
MIDAIAFDLDGTLYPLHGLGVRYLWHAFPHLRDVRVARASREDLRGRVFSLRDGFLDAEAQIFAERTGCAVADAPARITRVMDTALVRTLRPSTSTIALLQELAARVPIAIVSDRGAIESKLRALGLLHIPFASTLSAEDVGALKPDAALLHETARRLGVSAQRIVVVGDRDDTDGAMARNAGAAFLHAANGVLPRDALLGLLDAVQRQHA